MAEGLKVDIKDLGIDKKVVVEYIQVFNLMGDFRKSDVKAIAEEVLTDKVSQEYDFCRWFPSGRNGKGFCT